MSFPPSLARRSPSLAWLARTGAVCSVLASGCDHAAGPAGRPADGPAASAETAGVEASVVAGPERPAVPPPPAFKVEPRVWQATVRSQGGLIADELTVIGARLAGRIADVAVEVGQPVAAGDVLVRLDEAELRLRVEQARAELDRARVGLGL